jgi:BioD-like phosphotransacetylase family protein
MDENPDWKKIAGLVLTLGCKPDEEILRKLQDLGLPVLLVDLDGFTVATKINRMTVKTEPGDNVKIGLIQNLVKKHVDLEKILQAVVPAGETDSEIMI